MSPPLLFSTVKSAAKMKPSAENHGYLATAAGNDNKDAMDIDDSTVPDDVIVDKSCDKDGKPSPTTTESSVLSEVVELTTVDSELKISTDDDWLTSLLRYDDEAVDSSNGDS